MRRQHDMNPLLRIALPLILGIMTGNEAGNNIAMWVWLAATITALALSLTLRKNGFMQSITIYIIIFMLGGYLTRERLEKTSFMLPDDSISYESLIFSEPMETGKTIRCDIVTTNTSRPIKIKASFYKDSLSKALNIGDGIKATSIIKTPESAINTNFNYARYLRYHDYAGTTYISSRNWKRRTVDISHLPVTSRAKLSAIKLRARLLKEYKEAGIQERNLQIISAMTLGEKSLMAQDTKEAFSVSGASHILALSGMHLGIIYAMLSFFIGRNKRSIIRQALMMIAIWTFVFIAGMPLSAVRAAIMLTTYSFISLLNRDKVSINTLVFTAITILMYDPLCLYDTSFQMSFMAVIFILLLYQPIYKQLPLLHKNIITRYIWKITSVSIAAQIGVAPLIALYFGRISCYSLIANIMVVPTAMIIICGSIAVLAFHPIPLLQHIMAVAISELTEKMSSGITSLSSLPFSSIDITLSVVQTIMIYIVIFSAYCIYKELKPQQFVEP